MQRVQKNANGNFINSEAEIDFEALGAITVGTTEVKVRSDRDKISREFRIRANTDNTGIIYIGKTGVLSDGSNDFVRLNPGDEISFEYNDIANELYAISNVAAQSINVGVIIII